MGKNIIIIIVIIRITIYIYIVSIGYNCEYNYLIYNIWEMGESNI